MPATSGRLQKRVVDRGVFCCFSGSRSVSRRFAIDIMLCRFEQLMIIVSIQSMKRHLARSRDASSCDAPLVFVLKRNHGDDSLHLAQNHVDENAHVGYVNHPIVVQVSSEIL